ncbi:MFS transporter [Undibacterium sp. Ji67W]|uniref:MFS transporter n=1 Tax=Undibacterium sp. Ji67W TaxID=3413042 RepID=UPI003BF40118
MSQGTKHQAFEALKIPSFPIFVATFVLTMMADNVEHVISYWVAFEKFKSPTLGGFAVISHWLPFLLFSVGVGALNDRFDSRRLIQIGGSLFALVSLGWGYFFITDTLTIPWAMTLLVLHGFAGVFWMTSSQVLLYDIVGVEKLASAVRLNATARYFGVLVGPGVGSLIMSTLGPNKGILLNAALYLPLLIWLIKAPQPHRGKRLEQSAARRVSGLSDIWQTILTVKKIPTLGVMILLSGAASFFVGNSYQAQMPGFATDLGNIEPGMAYSMLLAADAAGALFAGITLEAGFRFARVSPSASMGFALAWAVALGSFAIVHNYPLALLCLFAAGYCELSFSSMNQTIVQMKAPDAIRGKVLGLFGMSSAGLRLFSGIFVGLIGSKIGIHFSLFGAALVFIVAVMGLMFLNRARSEVVV